MKNLLQSSRGEESVYKYVWKEFPTLDVQENPDLSSDEAEELADPRGAAGTVSLETEEYAERVKNTVGERITEVGLAEERTKNKRTPGNPIGVLFGSKFERQTVNPFFLLQVEWFSKNSILKNIAHAAPQIKDMLGESQHLSVGVASALYNHTHKATLKAVARGNQGSLDKASLGTFDILGPALDRLFEQAYKDASVDEGLGKAALNNRETFRKVMDLDFWRAARHAKMLTVIKRNLQSAQKEIQANMNRSKEHLTRQRDNAVNAVETYQVGLRNKNDSAGEGRLWTLVQSAIKDPERFLSGGVTGMVDLKKAFGTTNKVRILDAIQYKFSAKVLELERSQQLTLDQETLLENMDDRERMTNNALENTNFKNLYNALEGEHVQTYKTEDEEKPKNDEAVLKSLITGLRRLGINTRSDVFRDAPVGITTTERLALLMQYMASHLNILQNPKCSVKFKRAMYTWIQETQTNEAEQLAQGSHAEDGTPAQRRYILSNAIVVREAAHSAIGALSNIDVALRNTDPEVINEKLRVMKTFSSSFKEFFGEDGNSGSLASIIKNMPRDEQDLIRGMSDLKGLYSQIKETQESLQVQRKAYVEEVLKNLPPSAALLEEERLRARSMANRLSEMVGVSGGPGLNFSKDDFEALEKARSEIFARVKKWDDAQQDLANRHFDLPGTAEGFAGMLNVGRGLQGALDEIPGREDIETGTVLHDFNGLMQQKLIGKIQDEKETQFNTALNANMKHQMNTLLSRTEDKDGELVMKHAPEPGMTLDRLEVADVTNTDGELDFPESLQNREVFQNLTLARSGIHAENEKCTSADMVFHNNTHIVLLHEKQGQVVAESWKKPRTMRRNTVVRVPHTQPDAIFRVLNLSTAGTKAATRATGGRRSIRLAA